MKKNYFMPFLSPKKYKKALLVGLLALPVGYPPLPLSAKELSIFEQSYSLNLKFRNESLGSAIEQISRQAHVRIIYSNDHMFASFTATTRSIPGKRSMPIFRRPIFGKLCKRF